MPINIAVGREMTIIYLDRKGSISQRRIQVQGVQGERVKAYCYTARAPRVFLRTGILAAREVQAAGAGVRLGMVGVAGAGHAG
ncbi:hypothetical protein [Paenibacillus daejeonensis]|uniref:hypothetical protein n=1 Tax=Paenibacillus daejeonensis TaxID=135193 RepID=UPI0003600BC4|nr:hypothetical protein [Paenibacillus daejeonensis]